MSKRIETAHQKNRITIDTSGSAVVGPPAPLDASIHVRLTRALKERLTAAANADSRTPGEYARLLIQARLDDMDYQDHLSLPEA